MLLPFSAMHVKACLDYNTDAVSGNYHCTISCLHILWAYVRLCYYLLDIKLCCFNICITHH